MPHDANGVELRVGDKVVLAGTVVGIGSAGDYCNCDVELDIPMPAYPDTKTRMSALNTKQVVKNHLG